MERFADFRLSEGPVITDQLVDDVNRLLKQLSPKSRILTRDSLKKLLRQENLSNVFVFDTSKDDVPLVGMATVDIVGLLSRTRAVVEDVIVDDEYRGQGLGREIIDRIITIAKSRGADQIQLTSSPKREVARALYGSMGFALKDTGVFVRNLT